MRADAGGHVRLVLLVGAGHAGQQRAHAGERVADPLRGQPPLLVELAEPDRRLAVGPAVEHRAVDAAGQGRVPAGGVGGLGRHCPAMRLQGGDVDLHGSSSDPGPSRSRRTLGRRQRRSRPRCPQAAPLSTGRRLRGPGTPSPSGHDAAGDRRPPPPTAARARATRCWTLCGGEGAVDVEVDARTTDDRLGDVLPALGTALGRAGRRASGPGRPGWPDDLPLTAPELAHGAVLGLGGPVPGSRRRTRSSALELRVVGGPDAGRALPLGQGRHVHRPRQRRRASGSTIPTCPGGTSRSQVGGGADHRRRPGLDQRQPPRRRRARRAAAAAGRPARSCGSGASAVTARRPGRRTARAWNAGAGRAGCGCARSPRHERARRRGRGRLPRAAGRAAAPPAGLGRGRAARGRRGAHGLAAAHAHVPVLRAAQPGGRAGHLALRALVRTAQRAGGTPRRTRWTCWRRRRRLAEAAAADVRAARGGAPRPRRARHRGPAPHAPAVEPGARRTPMRSPSGWAAARAPPG